MDPYLSIKDYLATKSFKFSDSYSLEVFDLETNWKRDNATSDMSAENLTDIFSQEEIKTYGIETSKYGEYLSRRFHFKNCTEFTPPVYKPNEEVIKFCNTTRKVYTPNTSSCEPVRIQLQETDRLYARKFIKYCLRKSFYDETSDHFNDSYRPYRYLDRVVINVWNNSLTNIVMSHIFRSCRIADYDYSYNLDAASSTLILPTLTFSYLSYEIDTNPDPTKYNEWQSEIDSREMDGYNPITA